MKTSLIILGCGNSMGTPRIDGYWGKCNKKNKKNIRTRCSAAIIKGSNVILIDTSPDIRNQMIKNKIKNITSVLYTHEHSDQTNGLFELRPFTFSRGKKFNFWKNNKKINIYGSPNTITHLKSRFDYCFTKIGAYPPIVKANLIKKNFSLGKLNEKILFYAFQAKHGKSETTGYIFNNTAYLSDCNDLSIINNKRLRNLKYLIIDCLKIDKSYAHFSLKECLAIHRILKPKNTILTNLHQDLDYNFLHKELPKNVIPAYDGLKLNL